MRVDGSANPTMPKNPAQYCKALALAGARAELKFRSENSNAFSHGDQKMSASEAPPEAGRRTPATQLQLSN